MRALAPQPAAMRAAVAMRVVNLSRRVCAGVLMVTPEGVELCPFYGGEKALLKSPDMFFFEGLIEFATR
ncbi:hypothetical protein AB4Y44_19730 [Paraburkholderia sp. BR10937]|uniref:hypothetical protein n=1 Tax=Paraburkholderia sp. BR10937 TaxID=3236994 RepID=UPI0034D31542